MDEQRLEDSGKLLLRVTLGGLLLLHGVHKAQHGIDGIRTMLTAHGLPAVMAHGAWFGEIVAPVLVILGVGTRYAAAFMAVFMVMAVYLAHASQIASLSERSGGYALELQALYLLGAVSVALLGAGRFALGRGRFR